MFLLEGRPLPLDTPFTHEGVQYPSNWLRLAAPDERAAVGITEAPDPPSYDQRFQWGWADDGSPIWRDHAQLVEYWAAVAQQEAGRLLASTDWMIVRELDNGTPIDPGTKAWRESVRQAAAVKASCIRRTADTSALAAYVTGPDYSVWPVEGDSGVSRI